jgi:hypothetical protein
MPAAELSSLPLARLADMRAAADEVIECLRVLGKGGVSTVGRMLEGQGPFVEEQHYPNDDVYDRETGSQYYYHAHREGTSEHGHFHTFLRASGMPDGVAAAPYDGHNPPPHGADAICHFIAISMDNSGLPVGLFTTNRWVTAETFYAAPAAIAMIERFKIDHASPCWATNRWLSAMLRLYQPQIADLLVARDASIAAWKGAHPDRDVYEDRELEVTSEIAIDLDTHIAAVDAAFAAITSVTSPHTIAK